MKRARAAVRLLLCAACLGLPGTRLALAQDVRQVRSEELAIDLASTLQLAGAQNLDVQIARERLAEARAHLDGSYARFLPWIAPGVAYHRRDGLAQAIPAGTISSANFDSYRVGAALNLQVELGDAIYRALAARQMVKASDEALETERRNSIAGAARGYFELAKARLLIGVASEAVATAEEYTTQLHEAVAAGIAFKGDELRARTQAERFKITRRRAQERRRVAAAELARILHLDPRVDLVPREDEVAPMTLVDPQEPTDVLVQRALASRPELARTRALVSAAAEAEDGSVYGPLIPSVGAQVFLGGLGGGPDGGPRTFGGEQDYLFGLAWRIGPGGLFDVTRIDASRARRSVAELGDAKQKDAVAAEVVSSVSHVRSLHDQIALTRETLAHASETLRLTLARREYGAGIVLEVLQAQQDLNDARSEHVAALADYNAAQFDLRRVVGDPAADAAVERAQ